MKILQIDRKRNKFTVRNSDFNTRMSHRDCQADKTAFFFILVLIIGLFFIDKQQHLTLTIDKYSKLILSLLGF